MGNRIDLVGSRFGMLTVLRDTKKRIYNGSVIWECLCDCGNKKDCSSADLRRGSVKSCGCKSPKKQEMSGQRIGILSVICEIDKQKHGSPVWICLCDCGSFKEYSTSQLRSGKVKSCGCLSKSSRGPKKNLIGKRFGRLIVVGLSETRSPNGSIQWKCKCDCGNEIQLPTSYLNSGRKYCSHKCRYHPGRAIDLAGERFGNLTVINKVIEERGDGVHQRWYCKCDCGSENIICRSTELIAGRKISCGCTSGFKASRKTIYKKITGCDVGDNESVIFLDGNPFNQTIENMYLVSHEVYNKALIAGYLKISDPSIKLSAIKTCELQRKIYELESDASLTTCRSY